MKKAKFGTLEDQKIFFNSVKGELGIGAKKLAKLLGLKSRGSIESYTFGRTAPPLEIVRNLEKISGVKGDYQIVEGKVVRKERKFMPLDPVEGKRKLREKFGNDFNKIDSWIKSDLSIRKIVDKIRERKYIFDNSLVSKWIGAYRTSLKIRFSEELCPTKDEIILRGRVRKDNKTYSIGFNLVNLSKSDLRKEFRIGLEFSKDFAAVRLFPLTFGRKFNVGNHNIRILVTEKSGIKDGYYINVILRPQDFGFSIKDSIYDVDAKVLVGPLLKEGFVLDNYRSTPANHKGDLSVFYGNINYIIEITQAKTYHACYYKVGQSYIQKLSWPGSKQIFVCCKSFLIPSAKQALKKLKVEIIEVDFEEKWEQKVVQELKKII